MTRKRGAIVLAGGRSSRMGYNKALVMLKDKTMLAHVVERVRKVIDNVVLVIGFQHDIPKHRLAIPKHVPIINDPIDLRSPLVGIMAGIEFLAVEYVSVHPCDTPLLEPRLIQYLFARAEGHDAAIGITGDGRLQPLNAVYRSSVTYRSCKKTLEREERRCREMISRLQDIIYIPPRELMNHDPTLRTFVNVNTLQELEKLRGLAIPQTYRRVWNG